jgi:phosphodiester glycosidase
LLALIASQTFASADTWVDGVRIPGGYRVLRQRHVGTGVWHLALKGSHPDEMVNVARLERGSPNRLRVVLSNNRVAGPSPRTERTSSMCGRVDCLIAVNASFFTDGGQPVGGVFDDGKPIRSPIDSRPHFSLARDGIGRLGKLSMTTTLTAYYPAVPAGILLRSPSPQPHATAVNGLNVARATDRIVLYTPRFGPTTETKGGVELSARLVSPSTLQTGVSATIEFVGKYDGSARIPTNGVVLSGDGAGATALQTLWQDVLAGRAERRATIQIATSSEAVEGVAGKPILVTDGQPVTRSSSHRDSRTMIGWNANGDLLLVTVEGKQPGRSVGMDVVEAANLMRALGAVNALNLDGGGSTTFVLNGRLMNRPSTSSHHERAVAVALAIVPAS